MLQRVLHFLLSIPYKKLISTHYQKDSEPSFKIEYSGGDDFNIDAGKVSEINGNTVIKDKNEIYYSAGDFRSNDCIKLLEEADIVVTNPPFSFIIVNHDRLKQPDFSNNARNLEQESIKSFQLFCDYRTFFSIKTYTKCIDLFYIWVFNF